MSKSLNSRMTQLCAQMSFAGCVSHPALRTDVSKCPLCARDKMASKTARFPGLPENKRWEAVSAHVYTRLCVCRSRVCMCVCCLYSFQISIKVPATFQMPSGRRRIQQARQVVFCPHDVTYTGPCVRVWARSTCSHCVLESVRAGPYTGPSFYPLRTGLEPGLILLCMSSSNNKK